MPTNNLSAIEVRFKLSAMALPSMPMHLDDIIAAGAIKCFMASSKSESVIDYDEIIHNLPVEKYTDSSNNWVYKASTLKFTKVCAPFMRSVSQRIDKRLFALRREEGTLNIRQNTLNEASGPLKASIDLIPSAAYVEAVGYCVADIEKIQVMLSYIKNLGKKHNRGQGQVLELEIQPYDSGGNDFFWVNRNLPPSMKDITSNEHALASNIATQPPYWKNEGLGYAAT